MSKKKDYEELLKTMDSEKVIQNMDNHYSDNRFWSKLKKFGKQAGEKTVYYCLLLYYMAKDPAVPKSSKMIIVGALSYLIFPVDLIPDFIPAVGLADDATVIATAVYKVVSHIDDDIKNKAKQKLEGFFKDTSNIEI
ncbi:YkvA family protein [Sporosarcina jiandibaonis]|uniref:YkvA family protein n=1 Tax=Sporosarcina jiandibaonis TaxID=2715535 RepID=UPI0015580041|nr:YkvA family protein [Sporosarcina jiandibaonis]